MKTTTTRMRGVAGILAAAVTGAALLVPMATVWGQLGKAAEEPKASGRMAAHSETTFAHELLRLSQVDVIKLMATSASPDEQGMWKAEVPLVGSEWREISRSRAEQKKAVAEYVKNVWAYLDRLDARKLTEGKDIVKEVPDGFWGVDHVKFIFGDLTRSTIMSMEYFGSNEKSRAELKPIAELSGRVLTATEDGLLAIRAAEEKKKPFNDAAEGLWSQAYAAGAVTEYYRPFSAYFKAMSMDPAEGTKRRALLLSAVEGLKPYIESDDPSEDVREKEVKNPALLLRGKCYSEMGKYAEAAKDLVEAQKKENMLKGDVPTWLIFQAKYQLVVTKARNADFEGARKELGDFRATIPNTKEDQLAHVSLDILNFRVAWMEADAKPEAQRMAGRLEAMKVMSGIAAKGTMFRDLVYEQLSSQISDADEKSGKLLPLQSLALAWNKALAARLDDAKKDELLGEAARICAGIRANETATSFERVESAWLEAVCLQDLKKYEESAQRALAFAEMAPPGDDRIVPMINTALELIREIRKLSLAANPNAPLPASVEQLAQKALELKTRLDKVGGAGWWYALGLSLERQKKLETLAKAEECFRKVPSDDVNYLDAQFHLLLVLALKLEILNNQKADPQAKMAQAGDVSKQCALVSDLLSKAPPKNVSKEAFERAKHEYEVNVPFIQIGVLLNPLERAEEALTAIKTVETKFGTRLSDNQQGLVLRYRILAYQIKKEPGKAIEVVNEYAKKFPAKSGSVMQELVGTTYEEIDTAKKANNLERAKVLADQLVGLMGSLIEQTKKEASESTDSAVKTEGEKKVYLYRQLQGQMMIEAGRPEEAGTRFRELQAERLKKQEPEDAFNKIWNAHAEYAAGHFGKAQELYGELIPRLSPPTPEKPDAPAYWECYYKMIMANEELAKTEAAPEAAKRRAQNVQVLKDLRGVYGVGIGGVKFKDEYRELLRANNMEMPG